MLTIRPKPSTAASGGTNNVCSIYNTEAGSELIFRMSTYSLLAQNKGGPNNQWTYTFAFANNFLKWLPKDETDRLWSYYEDVTTIFDTMDDGDIRNVISKIMHRSEAYINGSNIIDLCCKFTSIDKRVVYPDLANKELRPHDTEELTFVLNDYVQLTSLCLMTKLLIPIWGEFIHRVTRDGRKMIENPGKEAFNWDMSHVILSKGAFAYIVNKLDRYVTEMANNAINRIEKDGRVSKRDSLYTAVAAGFTTPRIVEVVFAMIISKKLATYDPYNHEQQNRNLMTFISSSVNDTVGSIINSAEKRPSAISARVLTSMASDNDGGGGNVTLLERSGVNTAVPADIPVICREVIDMQYAAIIKELKISRQQVEKTHAFLMKNHVLPNIYSEVIVSVILGKWTGGQRSIQYYRLEQWAKVMAIVQVYMASRKVSFQLIALLSAKEGNVKNGVHDAIDRNILLNTKNNMFYRKLVETLPFVSKGNKIIETSIGEIQKWLFASHKTFNMSDVIWELLNIPNMNGEILGYDDKIIGDFCNFMIQHKNGSTP